MMIYILWIVQFFNSKVALVAICAFLFLFFTVIILGKKKKISFYSFIAPMKGPFLTPLPSLWEDEFSFLRCVARLEPTNRCLPFFSPHLLRFHSCRKIAD